MSDDEPVAEAVSLDRGPNREEMMDNFLPESEEWEAKTILDLTDPAAVAALSQIGQFYPEVDDLQDPVDDFLTMFLKSRTSVAGKSRDEIKAILQSAFGGTPEDNAANAFASMLAGDLDDD